jgi:signal peptidase
VGAAGSVIMCLVVAVVVTVIAGGLLGFRTLVITSGSMTPTIDVGAAVLSRSVPPLAVHPGDIVTFRDDALGQQLVTHRVMEMSRSGPTVNFVTKGDANHTTEHWSVPVSGRIGRTVLAVPDVGRLLALLTRPLARVVEILTAMMFFAFLLLRWIWFAPRARETAMAFAAPDSGHA